MDNSAIDTLVVAVQNGQREAFRELFLHMHRDVRLHLAAHGANAEQVDEALQAAFVCAFERISQYRPNGTFRAWLKTIARHQLIDRWRERQRLAEVEGAPLDELIAEVAIDQLQDDELTLINEQRSAHLVNCLEQLPEHARTLINRRYKEGLSLEILARRFKRSVSAVGVALHRIRGSLRRCIEDAS